MCTGGNGSNDKALLLLHITVIPSSFWHGAQKHHRHVLISINEMRYINKHFTYLFVHIWLLTHIYLAQTINTTPINYITLSTLCKQHDGINPIHHYTLWSIKTRHCFHVNCTTGTLYYYMLPRVLLQFQNFTSEGPNLIWPRVAPKN